MSIEQGNLTFEKARKSGDSLSKIEREIKQAEIKNKTKEDLSSLRNSISDELITKLYGDGMKVVSGDALHHINHITIKRLHIKWYDGVLDKRDDANHIWPGDTIKIEGNKAFRYHNGKKTEIGEVEKKKEDLVVVKAPQKEKDGTKGVNTPPNNPGAGNKGATPSPTEGGEGVKVKANKPKASTSLETTENGDITQTFIIKKGKLFLVGKDGVETESTRVLTPEMKEKIKQYEKVAILSSVLKIWLNQAKTTADGIIGKRFRDDYGIILEQIGKVENLFQTILTNMSSGNIQNIEKNINTIFNEILKAEDREVIIGSNDVKSIKNILLNGAGNKNGKLLKIYNLMRYKGLSGNTSKVKEEVSNHLLQQKEFKNISEILNNPKTLQFIKNGNEVELISLIGNKELALDLIESYNKISSSNAKHRSEYQDILNKNNIKTNVDDYIMIANEESISILLKDSLIRNQVEKMNNRGNENDSYIGLYANLSGLAEEKGISDYLVIGDDNIDTAIDIGATIALSAVTMGVGMAAARLAMGLVSLAEKTAIGSRIIKGAGLARFAGTATLEGVSFYEGTNLMNNALYSEGSFFENGGNIEEITKSIAFMGVLRGVGVVMQKAQLAKGLTSGGADIGFTGNSFAKFAKFTDKVPALMLKGTSVTGVLAEAGLLTGTSVGLEVAFGNEWEWTWGEYMQAIVMVGLFRILPKGNNKIKPKVKIEKSKNGGIKFTITESSTNTKGKKESNKSSKAKVETIPKTKIELPKNKTFTIKDGEKICKITTGNTGEIVKVDTFYKGGKGKMTNKKQFDEVLKIMSEKGVIFGRNGNNGLVYKIDGKIYNKNGNLSKAKTFNEIKTEKTAKQEKPESKTETPKEKPTETETTTTRTTETSTQAKNQETTKKQEPKEEVKKSSISKIKEIIENSPLSFINREFRSFFNKHDFEKGNLLLGKSITISKEGSFFKVNNGKINYTEKQLFKEIITAKHKRNKLISIAEKNIKNEEIKLGLDKPWYPFGRANIKIENGKIKKFNSQEKKYEDMKPAKIKKFLKENPKIMEEIIKKKLDKVNLGTLNWEGIGTGSKDLLWKAFKNSIFSKGHLKIIGFSSAFAIYDILVNKEKNKDKLLNEALLSFALSYIPMATLGILVIGKRAFQYGGGKIIDLGVKPIWNSKVVQHIVNNVGKYTIGGLTTVAGIKLYTAEDEK